MKKITAVLLALVTVLSLSLGAFAASGKVTYQGPAGSFIFETGSLHSPTDLFENFKGVMPGDTLTQKITVKNDASDKVKVKIYLRSLGAWEESEKFLSQLHLTVKKSPDNEMGYMFDAAADETAGLTDWVCLGTLYSGGTVDLDVLLTVPTSLDNEFQKQIGYLDWQFMVEEFPVEDGDPKPPQTGDDSRIEIYFALATLCLLAIVILLILGKRKKEKAKLAESNENLSHNKD